MMAYSFRLVLMLAATLWFGISCGSPAGAAGEDEADPCLRVPSELKTSPLALSVFRELVDSQPGNVTFSPVSLEATLRLLREGTAGRSRAELAALPLGQTGVTCTLQVWSAQALFIAEDMMLKPGVNAPLYRVPFATQPKRAAELINAWCCQQTQGLIPELVGRADIDGLTRLAAMNALYFKVAWLHPFDKARTRSGLFHAPSGVKKVNFMTAVAPFRVARGADWEAVALFYRREGRVGEPACWVGILPTGDARTFARALTPEKYNAIRRALAKAPLRSGVHVSLPKMTLDSGRLSLRQALEASGVKECFSRIDWSRFSDEEDLRLADVMQRCRVEISEEGTRAAAATAALVKAKSLPLFLRFERPFIWAIGDLTSGAAPCFLGLYETPDSL